MGADSKIEWTDSTWNPVRGCSRVSPGCGGPNHEGGCYAEKLAARFSDPGQPFHGFAERTKHGGRWTGKLALVENALDLPLRWRKPRRIFVNSMSDLFHEALPDAAIDKVFAVMALAPQHTFQLLTKRPARMRAYLSARGRLDAIEDAARALGHDGRTDAIRAWPLPNVWLGVSAERQQEFDERWPQLRATPAAVRFLSLEPLLGPIDASAALGWRTDRDGGREPASVDWIIVGGESGPHARPMHPDWARSLRDQCQAAGVPFFFKQWGEWTPGENVECHHGLVQTATWFDTRWLFDSESLAVEDGHVDDQPDLYRVGKRAAGRMLDGREWNEMPQP